MRSGRRWSGSPSGPGGARQRAMAWWSPESSTSGTTARSRPPGASTAGTRGVPPRTIRRSAERPQPEHAGDQARDRLDDRRRRHLAARQHEVAEPQLLVHQRRHPLVDPFVAPADQRQTLPAASSRARAPDRTSRPRGRQQDAVRRAARGRRGPPAPPTMRLDAEDHARPAPVGRVVDLAVAPRGEVARVRAVNRQDAGLDGLPITVADRKPAMTSGNSVTTSKVRRGGSSSVVDRIRVSTSASQRTRILRPRACRRSARSPAPAGSTARSPAPSDDAEPRRGPRSRTFPTATPSARPPSSSTAQPRTSST